MKTKAFLLVALMVATLACGGPAAPSDPTGNEGLGMCAPGVTDCVEVVVENSDGEAAKPTGNAQNPTPITEGEFLGAEGNDVRVRVWTGVEPCDTLHSVEVTETAESVDLAILHGAVDPSAICPAIAMEQIIVARLQAPLGDRILTISGVELA